MPARRRAHSKVGPGPRLKRGFHPFLARLCPRPRLGPFWRAARLALAAGPAVAGLVAPAGASIAEPRFARYPVGSAPGPPTPRRAAPLSPRTTGHGSSARVNTRPAGGPPLRSPLPCGSLTPRGSIPSARVSRRGRRLNCVCTGRKRPAAARRPPPFDVAWGPALVERGPPQAAASWGDFRPTSAAPQAARKVYALRESRAQACSLGAGYGGARLVSLCRAAVRPAFRLSARCADGGPRPHPQKYVRGGSFEGAA